VALLQGVGARVEVANNGREAVEMLTRPDSTIAFDMVLMDAQMPEVDGYQATAKIRSDPRFAGLPIIAMTAHETVEERNRCLSAGMNDHLTKPIDPTILYDSVERYCKRGPSQLQASAIAEAAVTIQGASEIPAIEGLNTSDGLRRVAGNAKLYRNLLRQFVEGQADAAGRILESLDNGERALAERLAHTVKGVAGTIGAIEIQVVAGELEKAIRDRTEGMRVEALRVKLEAALAGFSAALRPFLESQAVEALEVMAPAGSASPVDPAALRSVVAELTALLDESDAAALDCLDSHQVILRPLFAPGSFQAFERLVTSYSFDEAVQELRRAAEEKGV